MHKSVTATELARNLRRMLDDVEFRGVELEIVRNKNSVARLIPGTGRQTALEAMADLYRTLPESAATGWVKASRSRRDRAGKLRDPWAT